MSEIQKVNQGALSRVSESNLSNSVIMAQKSEMIVEMRDDTLMGDISKLLSESAEILGHKNTFKGADGQIRLNGTVRDLQTTIKRFYPALRRSELKICFSYGRVGMLGEFVSLNGQTVVAWIKAYLKSMKEPVMAKESNRAEEQEQKTEKEIEEIYKELDKKSQAQIRELYVKTVETGKNQFTVSPRNLAFYMYMQRQDKLNVSNDRKKEIFQEEKLRYVKNSKSKGETGKDFKAFIQSGTGGSHKTAVQNMCKERVFLEHIKDCIDFGVEDPTE